jgi:predicted amino acid-binding ACT domain protein
MKFVSGIMKQARVDGRVIIEIPRYHRASISLLNGKSAYCLPRSPEKDSPEPFGRELILTPLSPDRWHQIKRITITCEDDVGVLNQITGTLKAPEFKFNIIVQEALTTHRRDKFSVTLFVEIADGYFEEWPVSGQCDDPRDRLEAELNEQNCYLETKLQESLKLKRCKVRVNELSFLDSISKEKPQDAKRGVTDEQYAQFRSSNPPTLSIDDGKITLSEELIDDLDIKNPHYYYSMVSDTEEKYIKVLFYKDHQKTAFIDIHHTDDVGVIAEYTRIFREARINIISCYSHPRVGKHAAHWYALVDITQKAEIFFHDNHGKGILHKLDKPAFTKQVFLIETNVAIESRNGDEIGNYDDAVYKYGQNKLTHDGLETTVFKRKKFVLVPKKLEHFGIEKYKREKIEIEAKQQKAKTNSKLIEHSFYSQNESFVHRGAILPLYAMQSECELVESVIAEQEAKNADMLAKKASEKMVPRLLNFMNSANVQVTGLFLFVASIGLALMLWGWDCYQGRCVKVLGLAFLFHHFVEAVLLSTGLVVIHWLNQKRHDSAKSKESVISMRRSKVK